MCKKEPKISESESNDQERESDVADFVLDGLSRATANLRVGDSRLTGARPDWVDQTPFGCPMGRNWEVWLAVRIKPRKETLIRIGKFYENLILNFTRFFRIGT